MSDFSYENLASLTTRIKVGFVGPINEFYCEPEIGVPIIRTTDINDINFDNVKYVTNDFHIKNKKSQLKKGDLIIARHGNNGNAVIYQHDINAQVLNAVIIEPDQSKVSSELLKIFFDSPFIKKQILGSVKGSVQGVINTKHISDLILNIGTNINYDFVTRTITNINKKIEVNNEINTKLEATAKLIYDYWFIQFDFPDANGKPYKSSGGKMVYNKQLKREIPDGWAVDVINNVIEVKDGTHDSPKAKESGYPLITSKHLKPAGLDFESANLISEEDYESVNKRSKVDTGDILFSMIGSIGEIYKVDEEAIDFAIKNIALYKSSKKPEYINFIYTFLKSYDMQRYMGNVTSGSIQKFIGLGALRNMPIFTNDNIIMKFVKTTEHFFQKKTLIKLENQELTKLRNWLLPMLMNGQVTVK